MKRDFLAAALVCVIAVLITGGCAGNSSAGNTPQTSAPASESSVESQLAPAESTDASGKKVELLFYHHMAEMTEYLTDFCDDMTEKYPNIKIEQETQKDTATLQVKYAAGDDPDLVLGPQTQQYYDQGKYLDLTDEYAEIISQLDPDLMDVITDAKTGKIFRIPQCINTFGIFYNKDYFAQLGLSEAKNWDEFIKNAEAVRDNMPDVIPVYFQSGNLGHQVMYLPLGLRMRDVGLLEIQKAASFNDTETLGFVSAGYLKLYADTIIKMRDEKLYDPEIAITGNAATANEAFATGKTAMLFNGTWWYGSVRNQFPEVDDFIGFQPIPAMDNKVLYGSKGQDSALSVSAISPYQEEIKTIVKEIFSDERLMAWSNKRGAPSSFPKVKSQWGSPEIMDRINNIFENEYCQVIQTFAPAGFGLDVMGAQVQEIIVDTMKPEDYPQTFQDFWDSCF